jgi:hypothetical protein
LYTYRLLGLDKADAPTPYYYGSVPAKPEPGQLLRYDETGNRYVIVRIEGEGLVDDGDGYENQRALAWADINRGEAVPTLWLQKVDAKEPKIAAKETKVASGQFFDYEEFKKRSQTNSAERLGGKKIFYIKGIGGYLCSTERLVMNQKKNAPAAMNATALEFATKEEAEAALATALKKFGSIPNQLKVVEE